MPKNLSQFVMFGKKQLPISQLFILRKNVYATVNLQPIVPGKRILATKIC